MHSVLTREPLVYIGLAHGPLACAILAHKHLVCKPLIYYVVFFLQGCHLHRFGLQDHGICCFGPQAFNISHTNLQTMEIHCFGSGAFNVRPLAHKHLVYICDRTKLHCPLSPPLLNGLRAYLPMNKKFASLHFTCGKKCNNNGKINGDNECRTLF